MDSLFSKAFSDPPWAPHDERARHHARGHRETRHHAGGIPAHPRYSRPRSEFHRTRHLFRHVERALLLQELQAGAEKVSRDRGTHPGQGRRGKRWRARRRRRMGGCFQNREPQPSQRGRAVPGRGHRRGRYHPRYFHHGRPARLPLGFAAVRPDRKRRARLRGQSASALRRGFRHRSLRQLHRSAHHRR